MVTHSTVLAWKIPGMGEPGGLLSMGSHRVGHDWSDLAYEAYILVGIYSALYFQAISCVCYDFEQLLSLFVLNFSSVNGCDYQFWDVWLFWELKIHSFVSPEDFNICLLIWPSCLAPTDSVLPLSFCCVSLLLWNRNKIHAHSSCCLSFISISPYTYYQQMLLPEL